MTNPFAKAYRITHSILYPIFSFFHPVEVIGAENVPEGPVLMCANHSSAWDPIQVIMALPKTYPLRIMAKKLLNNARKLEHISRRSTRQKLLSYFTEQMNRHQSPAFDIPFTRQQLADYLGVDRSALSAELGRMQRDGLIRYKKNDFTLIK